MKPMRLMQINIHLSSERALELGLTQWGDGTVAPNEDQLRQLSAAERKALGGYVLGGGARWVGTLHVQSADWSGVVTALREKMREEHQAKEKRERELTEHRATLEAFLRAGKFYDPETLERFEFPFYGYSNDPRTVELNQEIKDTAENQFRQFVLEADAKLTREDKEGREKVLTAAKKALHPLPTPRAIEFERLEREETRMAEEAEKEMNEHAIRTLLEVAAPALVERFDAGVLPEEELTPIVEDHLFKMFDYPTKFARYQLLEEDDIEHLGGCPGFPKFKSEPYGGTFAQDEWTRLIEVEEKAPEDAAVEVREHRAWCGDCLGDITKRYSIRVSRSFAGKVYHRAFALN